MADTRYYYPRRGAKTTAPASLSAHLARIAVVAFNLPVKAAREVEKCVLGIRFHQLCQIRFPPQSIRDNRGGGGSGGGGGGGGSRETIGMSAVV